jgi:hypothetical protein
LAAGVRFAIEPAVLELGSSTTMNLGCESGVVLRGRDIVITS